MYLNHTENLLCKRQNLIMSDIYLKYYTNVKISCKAFESNEKQKQAKKKKKKDKTQGIDLRVLATIVQLLNKK